MGGIQILNELTIIAIIGVVVSVWMSKLRLPAVTGILLAGALVGPYGFRVVNSVETIELLAEIGTVLLLFTIGLEFSLERLKHIFKQVALGGLLQVGFTTIVACGVAVALGESWQRGVFYGFIFALSSTAIVLRALTERNELDAPHGRFIVGTLIFQDFCVVPMALIIPLLSPTNSASNIGYLILLALTKALFVVISIVLIARWVVPRVLAWVDASQNRQIFLLAVLALCIGTAWLTSFAELTLALGAFLGGIVVADTEYGHRAMGDVLPLRDTFISIFFASLGMLFNPQVVWDSPALVGLLVCGFVLGKGFLATLAAQSMRFPARVALLAGAGLGQFGELGFVLAGRAVESNVIDESTLAPVLAAGIISMFLTPVMIRLAPHFTAGERMLAPLERLIGVRSLSADEATSIESLKGHVVLIGFGVAGQLTARALAASNIPYMILDLNADNVRKARAQGEPIFYGDATSAETLGHAHLDTAAALVVLINDPSAVQRVLDTARRVVPQMPILLRTHYLGEKEKLLSMGATDVVAEEIEGGIEILSRLLRWFSVPRNVITDRLELIRQETQTTQRQLQLPPSPLVGHEELADLEIDKILVKVGCLAEGRTTAELQLRQNTSALVVAVRRAGTLLEYPDPNENFQAGDIVYLVGSHDAIIRAERFFV